MSLGLRLRSFCPSRRRTDRTPPPHTRFVLAIAISAIPSAALAERISVDLDIPPSTNTLTMTIAAMDRDDTQTATVSGNLLANLDMTFDNATQALTSIDTLELTGGRFVVSNLTFLLSYGFLGHIDITAKDVSGTFRTPNPPSLVTAGSFNAADHQAIFDKGILRAEGTGLVGGLLPVNPYVVDISQDPLIATNTGAGTVNVTAYTVAGNTATYDLSLRMPVNVDQLVNPEPAVSVNIVGTLIASGQFSRTLPPPIPTWNYDGGGSWTDSAKWLESYVPSAPGALAYFTSKLTVLHAPATITLDGDKTVGQLFFRNTNQHIIAQGTGGCLILDNKAQGAFINVASGKHTISAPLLLADNTSITVNYASRLNVIGGISAAPAKNLTKTDRGVLNVSGGISLDALSSLTVQQGILYADRLSVGPLRLAANTLVSLDPNPASLPASIVHALDIAGSTDAWEATLDLNDSAFVVQSTPPSLSADYARIFNQIKCARNAASGPWTGPGITSTTARDDLARSAGYTGLAAVINDKGNDQGPIYALFKGVNADINSILIKYTYNGDANLDGLVNADDYFLIDSNYIPQKPGYHNGDFNYDGIVNADDYFLIDFAFLGQTAPLSMKSIGNAPVPEPSTIVLAGLVAVNLLALRRRRRA